MPGRIILGGNFSDGVDFSNQDPAMYAVLVEYTYSPPVSVLNDLYIFEEELDFSNLGETFIYKVKAVDVAGNIGKGVDSEPILLDPTPPCPPTPCRRSTSQATPPSVFPLGITSSR
ncbi:hypothetical protein IH922_09795, partial [candidate division KSB1 bacterium]|nr:hypothetical protein [candidate division KSB1 bacterium]